MPSCEVLGVLGLILFVIHVKDIVKCMEYLKTVLFVDDFMQLANFDSLSFLEVFQ